MLSDRRQELIVLSDYLERLYQHVHRIEAERHRLRLELSIAEREACEHPHSVGSHPQTPNSVR